MLVVFVLEVIEFCWQTGETIWTFTGFGVMICLEFPAFGVLLLFIVVVEVA